VTPTAVQTAVTTSGPTSGLRLTSTVQTAAATYSLATSPKITSPKMKPNAAAPSGWTSGPMVTPTAV
jgi:hypothetical protein